MLIKGTNFDEEIQIAIHNSIRRCSYPFIIEKFCLQTAIIDSKDLEEYRKFRSNEILRDMNSKFPKSGEIPFSDFVTIKTASYKKNSIFFQELGFTVVDWTTFQVTCNPSFPTPITNFTNDHFMSLGSESFRILCDSIQSSIGMNGKPVLSNPAVGVIEQLSSIEWAFQKYWNSVFLQFLPENIDSIPDLDIMSCHLKRLAFDILSSKKCVPSDYWNNNSINYALYAQNDLEVYFLLDIVSKTSPAFEDLLCRHFNFSKQWTY